MSFSMLILLNAISPNIYTVLCQNNNIQKLQDREASSFSHCLRTHTICNKWSIFFMFFPLDVKMLGVCVCARLGPQVVYWRGWIQVWGSWYITVVRASPANTRRSLNPCQENVSPDHRWPKPDTWRNLSGPSRLSHALCVNLLSSVTRTG